MLQLGLIVALLLVFAPGFNIALENSTQSQCQDGIILSFWDAEGEMTTLDRVMRGVVYMVLLIYFFLGVSIISDRFMSAIEVITSQEREVSVTNKAGTRHKVTVRVWNETVANLTLMALGSSAPEILLSVIEIWGKGFSAGELGPGTIVGSAAYNLFVIIALCVAVIPNGEVRKIKHLRVFFVTATWSVFAYIWLYAILAVFSPGIVEVWEGLLTFLFFPATVLTAYFADKKLASHEFKKFRLNKNRVIVAAESGDIEMEKDVEEEILEENETMNYATTLRELRQMHPNLKMEELEKMAENEIMKRVPKSRAFYRIQASRNIMGSFQSARKEKPQHRPTSPLPELGGLTGARIFFKPQYYTVLENVGEFEVVVAREGDVSGTVTVEYATEDGTAQAGSDYVGAAGKIVFQPGELEQRIRLQVIDDDVFEEDEYFFVHLTKVKDAKLVAPSSATVMILDDDHAGSFGFLETSVTIAESVGMYELEVLRSCGARGTVEVGYKTYDDTAKAGTHYVQTEGALIFHNEETR
ncbi:hypothetical protein M8J76_002761 [Diaphorina citri]|nr:hypothetical protein M8J75_014211 [Diaphorina citri]KAI5740326.1 hypothetical protein M8J76_002761 [Diaphorina citri]KAI5746475.1 hypothetical protein M8J77_003963 [Diaphorina citri]